MHCVSSFLLNTFYAKRDASYLFSDPSDDNHDDELKNSCPGAFLLGFFGGSRICWWLKRKFVGCCRFKLAYKTNIVLPSFPLVSISIIYC